MAWKLWTKDAIEIVTKNMPQKKYFFRLNIRKVVIKTMNYVIKIWQKKIFIFDLNWI